MNKKILFIIPILIVIIAIGFYTNTIQDIVYETIFEDEEENNIIENIGEPTTNNYQISPPEIKNFGERLDET